MCQWPRPHLEFFSSYFQFFKRVNKLHTNISAMLNWFYCETSFNAGRTNDNNITINTRYELPLDLFLDPLFSPLLINQPPSCLWTLAGSPFGTRTPQRSHCFNVNRMLLIFFFFNLLTSPNALVCRLGLGSSAGSAPADQSRSSTNLKNRSALEAA